MPRRGPRGEPALPPPAPRTPAGGEVASAWLRPRVRGPARAPVRPGAIPLPRCILPLRRRRGWGSPAPTSCGKPRPVGTRTAWARPEPRTDSRGTCDLLGPGCARAQLAISVAGPGPGFRKALQALSSLSPPPMTGPGRRRRVPLLFPAGLRSTVLFVCPDNGNMSVYFHVAFVSPWVATLSS